MPDSLQAAYDAVNYDSKPIVDTHVAALETMARLHGLQPPPSDRCRVLELGCATGGNLVAMAYQLPNSRFVGIDLAPSHIELGNRSIKTLGLANIELHAQSID
ncbi:MAG TPA: methyltransferase domain-containing protein, partial [Gemmatimonadaceae bacterium]|nr:methyltransferase domain-containing protein [Gemmatimonadaceae bacterium]